MARRCRRTPGASRTARRARQLRTYVLNLCMRVGRNGVPTMTTPGMAAGKAANCEPRTGERTMLLECVECVRRARRIEAARRRAAGPQAAVQADDEQQGAGGAARSLYRK